MNPNEGNGQPAQSPDPSVPSPTPAITTPDFSQVVIAPHPEVAPLPDNQAQPTSKKRRLLLLSLALVLIIAGAVGALLYLSKKKDKAATTALTYGKVVNAYDSPIGLLPPFQQQKIRSGNFKITAQYVTGGQFSREGKFYVNNDGEVNFVMLPDTAKVNSLMKYLADGGETPITDPEIYEATANFKYDFQSLLGYYDSFYSRLSTGFVPEVNDVIKNPKNEAAEEVTVSSACVSNLDKARSAVSSKSLNTKDLNFSLNQNQGQVSANFNTQKLQVVDKAELSFLTACFKDKKQSLANQQEARLVKTDIEPPLIKYSKGNDDRWTISYVEPRHQDNRIVNFNMSFTVWNLSNKGSAPAGKTKSFSDYSNLYGLAYSLCRVEPVELTDLGYEYDFLAAGGEYSYPSFFNSGFYCSTLDADKDSYHGSNYLQIKFPPSKAVVTAQDDEVKKFKAIHDLEYEIEKYYLKNHIYPTAQQLPELAGSLGDLSKFAKGVINDGSFTYTATPSGCTEKCTAYSRVYWLKQITSNKVTFTRKSYSSPP